MSLSISNQRLTTMEDWFDDNSASLKAISSQPGAMAGEIMEVVNLARKFKEEFVRPQAIEMDKRIQEDHSYLPEEWVDEACRRGFFTLCVPKIFGGQGYCFPALSYFMEEIASVCLGMANIIGAHYLGLGTLICTWNLPLIARVCQEIVEGERSGKACMVSLAMTEPTSGSDTPEPDLLDKGQVACLAKKKDGGYRVNGSKIFISNGHFSTWHMTVAFEDLARPSETAVILAVRNGAKGFQVAGKESKMGQLACPASELVFNDCFIPNEQVALSPDMTRGYSRTHREIYQHLFDDLCSISRAGVCALSAGAARGAYESALAFAATAKKKGDYLINSEWVQCRLAEMYKNAVVARLLYIEANYANGNHGIYKGLQAKPVYYALRYLPKSFLSWGLGKSLGLEWLTGLIRKRQLSGFNPGMVQRTAGLGALAKFASSDAACENGQLAMEMMGAKGLRHGLGVEKRLRDIKLLQIYEGTNQICRMDLFRNLIARRLPQAKLYEECV